MNILCFIDSLGSGGAQRQMVELAFELKRDGHKVSFLIYHNDVFFKSKLDRASIPVKIVKEGNYLKRFLIIRRYIRHKGFDVVLSFLMSPNLINELSGFPFHRWKIVACERSANPELMKGMKYKLFRLAHLLADNVVANSFANMRMIKESNPLLSNKKLKVIYNIVDTEEWATNSGISRKDLKTILVPASHHRVKNLSGLVEAMNLLEGKLRKQILIEWYGNKRDNSFEEAQEKIVRYGLAENFKFCDAVIDLNSVMNNCDAVGLFSFYEGLPNAICEALAGGKPVIVTSVSDIPMFIEEGINGFLCDANDSETIALAIKKFLDAENSTLMKICDANRKKAKDLFSKEKIVKEYLKVFKNVQ